MIRFTLYQSINHGEREFSLRVPPEIVVQVINNI